MEFLTTVLDGLTLISVLALVSLGLAVIFGLMHIINLAHGEFLALGAYAVVLVTNLGGSFWLALLIAPVVGLVAGLAVEKLLVRKHYQNPTVVILSTWGLGLVVQQALQYCFGKTPRSVGVPIGSHISVGDTAYPTYKIFLIAATLSLVILCVTVVRRTSFGLHLRAAMQDRELATSVGVDFGKVSQIGFGGAAALAAAAGALLSPEIAVTAHLGVNYLARSFIVVILGASTPLGALTASAGLGGTETVLAAVLELSPTTTQALVLLGAVLFVSPRFPFSGGPSHV